MKNSFILITISLTILTIIQLLFGNISLEFFRFPLNILLALLWIAIVCYQNSSLSKGKIIKTISSSNFSIAIISTFSIFLVILGLVKQDDSLIDPLGLHNFTTSSIFVGVLFMFITNLTLITINYLKTRRKNRIRFFLIHFGLICSLGAGFLGASDQEIYRIMSRKDKPTDEMYDTKGNIYKLGYKIKLLELDKEYYSNGIIARCAGKFLIDNKETDIEVNSPYSQSLSEDIYMVSYNRDNSEYCILEIVKQPWKYIMLPGIVMTIIGAFMLFINGPTIRKGEIK